MMIIINVNERVVLTPADITLDFLGHDNYVLSAVICYSGSLSEYVLEA